MQFIQPNGEKRFLKGGSTSGGYFVIGKPTDHVWLVEGYATGASVHMATGKAVVVAFSSNNLPVVTKHLVGKSVKVYIAADNDAAGWQAAGKARLVGAEYRAAPDLAEGTDWNDYCALYGSEQTMEVLYGA